MSRGRRTDPAHRDVLTADLKRAVAVEGDVGMVGPIFLGRVALPVGMLAIDHKVPRNLELHV